ncbi:MAG: ABC transporter permease [Kineosporiaceae bacterium]
MLRVSYRNVTGRFWTLVLTALSVVLGTAFVAGSLVFTDSIDQTLTRAFDSTSDTVDVVVRGVEGAGSAGGFGDGRVALPLSLADDVEQVDGVESVEPELFGSALIVGADGTAVRNGQAPAFGYGFLPDDPTQEIVDGRGPESPDEIAVESTTLERSGLSVGDTTTLVAGTEPTEVTIVGEAEIEANFGSTIVLLDPETAEAAFAPDGTATSFNVRGEGEVDQQALADRVAEVVPDEAETITQQQLSDEAQEQISSALGFVNTFLLVVAGVSLFVGALIIFNVFSMLLARRTRELALLRAVGAARSQVLGSVVVESVVVGLLGSALGLGLGLLVALALQALVGSIGFEIPASTPVDATTVAVTVGAGLLVTVLSAVLPAVRASRIPPVAALRDDVALPERAVRLRTAIGLVLAVLGAAGLLVGILGDVPGPLYVIGAGVLLTFIGVLVAGPGLARPVVWLVSVPTVAIWGTVARLARRNAIRNPRRTAATAGALMIGTALVGAATIVASSVNASVAEAVENELRADFVLDSGQTTAFPTSVADEVADVPGVELAVPVRAVSMLVAPEGSDPAEVLAPPQGGPAGQAPEGAGAGTDTSGEAAVDLFAVATGLEQSAQVLALDIAEGGASGGEDSLALNRSTAEANDWEVGDVVTARAGAAEPQEFTVTAIYEDSTVLPEAVVDPAVYDAAVPQGQQSDNQVLVRAQEGADLEALRADLAEVVEPYYVISVLDGEEFTGTATQAINVLLGVIAALVGLSILVAAIGIVITLVLSVIERQREIGLLRAVGLTRMQLRRAVTLEGVSTSIFGALLGITLGVVFGLALQRGLAADGLDTLSVPWTTLIGMLVGGAVLGIVAAAAPAWWASRQPVLEAIATE